MSNIKILSATHKPYIMPEDRLYIPVQVNAAVNGHFEQKGTEQYAYDDEGNNISRKNPYYCELTALYWGWKNLDCDYLGLVHYRRYFRADEKHKDTISAAASVKNLKGQYKPVLSETQASDLINFLEQKNIYVILPKKRHYYIETLYSHYAHSHHEADLTTAADVIHNYYPEYSDAYVEVMKRRSSHMFNMCIMRRDILDAYCKWLFDVLEKTETGLDITQYTDFDKRVFGRISELLLDVWITKNNISYYELPVINLEGEHWGKKILKFVRRKIRPEHDF